MLNVPVLKIGSWIKIGNTDCVVGDAVNMEEVEPEIVKQFGQCTVVYGKKSDPTSHRIYWTGTEWLFCETGDYGGHAEKNPYLTNAVKILKAGIYPPIIEYK